MAYYRDKQLQALYDSVDNWIATLKSKNPIQIADLYTDSAVLLGTVAENVKVGRRMIEDYFEKFVAKDPVGEVDVIMVKALGDKYGIANGSYAFTVNDEFSESGRIKIPK